MSVGSLVGGRCLLCWAVAAAMDRAGRRHAAAPPDVVCPRPTKVIKAAEISNQHVRIARCRRSREDAPERPR